MQQKTRKPGGDDSLGEAKASGLSFEAVSSNNFTPLLHGSCLPRRTANGRGRSEARRQTEPYLL
jgi:hypothetical protein